METLVVRKPSVEEVFRFVETECGAEHQVGLHCSPELQMPVQTRKSSVTIVLQDDSIRIGGLDIGSSDHEECERPLETLATKTHHLRWDRPG